MTALPADLIATAIESRESSPMRRISILILAVLFGGTAICTAQQHSKLEIFGGFSLQRASGYPNLYSVPSSSDSTNYDAFTAFRLTGGEAEVTYFPFAHVGITGDFATASKSQTLSGSQDTQAVHEYEYLFGPTVRYALKGSLRLTVFAHQLFGVGHTSTTFTPSNFDCTETSPTCSANPSTTVSGGGVDIRVNSHISVRPAQLDYWEQQISERSFSGGGVTDSSKFGVNGFRYSVGAVVNF